MAAILLFLLFLSPPSVAIAQQKRTNISIGDSLSPANSTSWRSPSGFFAFGFYNESGGFRVGIWMETTPRREIVWTANRDNPPVSSKTVLVLTNSGLSLQIDGAQDTSLSSQIPEGSCSSGSMLDSGNFVLYDFNQQLIWASFDNPTDTIVGGQTLKQGNQLFSSVSETDHSTGRFRLAMQSDSNLVLYPVNTTNTSWNAYWSIGISEGGSEARSLHLYENGSLYFVNSTSRLRAPVAEQDEPPSNGTFIHRATLDADGIFRLYSHNFSREDGSPIVKDIAGLEKTCNVKGFCGFNSYCTLLDDQPNCQCIPGFHFIDPDRWFLGCRGNFSGQGCLEEDMNITYSIETVEKVVWICGIYATLSSVDEDGCREDCLNDCNCGAAIFEFTTCKKATLPLLYGQKKAGSKAGTTFVKLGIINPSISNVGNNTNMSTGSIREVTINKSPGTKNRAILIVAIVLAICSIAVFSFSRFLISTNRPRKYRNMLDDGNHGLLEEIVLRSFSYDELIEATDNFKEELGKGGFGTVYKGSLYIGDRRVAVKRLEKVVEEGEREFRAEMRAIGRTHHKNLVRLLGFCDEGSNRLLVYEYMSNGSLANLLFKTQARPDWSERVRIALDVAKGIFYLHEECDPHIIHCDIKPQNILMDDFWTPKISDFGLAKLLMADQTRTLTMVRGTRGYLAPEWSKNTPISVKTDVYSFGIVLLEIICCRRNVELEVEEDEIMLTEWVYKCFKGGDLQKLLGDEEVEWRFLDRMVKVGLLCIQDEPAFRPPMKNVILMMEGNMEVPVPPSPTSSRNVSS